MNSIVLRSLGTCDMPIKLKDPSLYCPLETVRWEDNRDKKKHFVIFFLSKAQLENQNQNTGRIEIDE